MRQNALAPPTRAAATVIEDLCMMISTIQIMESFVYDLKREKGVDDATRLSVKLLEKAA